MTWIEDTCESQLFPGALQPSLDLHYAQPSDCLTHLVSAGVAATLAEDGWPASASTAASCPSRCQAVRRDDMLTDLHVNMSTRRHVNVLKCRHETCFHVDMFTRFAPEPLRSSLILPGI